jgi:uncharacterized protein (DUF302 family)
METTSALGVSVRIAGDFETNQDRVRAALKQAGFGVLTEIDVQSTLMQKLGVDFRPYKILGACNPSLAYRALTAAPEVGLLLPCNVTLSQIDRDITEVSIVDPMVMLGFVGRPGLEPIAEEARARLARVIAVLKE